MSDDAGWCRKAEGHYSVSVLVWGLCQEFRPQQYSNFLDIGEQIQFTITFITLP